MKQSVRILRQCAQRIPDGEVRTKLPRSLALPKGEVYLEADAAALGQPLRGELHAHLVQALRRDQDRAAVGRDPVGDLLLLQALDDGTGVLGVEAAVDGPHVHPAGPRREEPQPDGRSDHQRQQRHAFGRAHAADGAGHLFDHLWKSRHALPR